MTARRPFGPGRSAAGRQDRAEYDRGQAAESQQPLVLDHLPERLAGQISPEPRRREIEQMVADAEAHRSEDAELRAEVDTRNELDTVAYQVQRTPGRERREDSRARARPRGAAGQ